MMLLTRNWMNLTEFIVILKQGGRMARARVRQKASLDQARTSKTSRGRESQEASSSQDSYAKAYRQEENGLDPLVAFKALFKHGHPKFTEFCFDIAQLHDKKNKFYAGGGDPLGNFKRVANIMRS